MHFHIVTIFPQMFASFLGESIIKRALVNKKIKVSLYDIRDFADNKHRKVDDRPYGGGPGMVLSLEPIVKAVLKAVGRKTGVKIYITAPRGRKFTNENARDLVEGAKHVVIICGRYEGIDARVKKTLSAVEVSIGNYTLTGGELPAMVIMDAIARQVPGVLGNALSIEEKRTASREVYTRPEVFTYKKRSFRVPKVLLSGHHRKQEEWRKDRAR